MTDGLRAEREQGITIDVAYRYAATPHRKFVIADCPGHVQYTRNMATGASTADLALVLVDATSGLREQSRRHICIAALLGVDQLVVCANKMDLVEWDRSAYQRIVDEMEALAHRLGISVVHRDPHLGAARRQRGRRARTPPRGTTAPPCSTPWSRPRPAAGPPSTASAAAAGPGCRCSGCCASPAAAGPTPGW